MELYSLSWYEIILSISYVILRLECLEQCPIYLALYVVIYAV